MEYFMMIFNKKEYYWKLEILAQEWMGYQSLKVSILYELFKKERHYNALNLNPGASYLEVTKTLKVLLW